jgi:hypothetical protein
MSLARERQVEERVEETRKKILKELRTTLAVSPNPQPLTMTDHKSLHLKHEMTCC